MTQSAKRAWLVMDALVLVFMVIGCIWIMHRAKAAQNQASNGQIASLPPPPMPVYQGRTAQEWLAEAFSTSQEQVLEAFRAMGTNALPFLVNIFRENDLVQRNNAEFVIVKMPYASNALPDLTRLFIEGNHERQMSLMYVLLSLIGPSDTNCVPALTDYVKTEPERSREYAVLALGHIGPGAQAAIPTLTSILYQPIPGRGPIENELHLRMTIARVIWKINQESNATARVLRMVIANSTEIGTQSGALAFLSDMRPDDKSLIEPMIQMLSVETNENRMGLAARIGHYGTDAKSAVPALIPLLKSTNSGLRDKALQSLRMIDPEIASKYEER